MIDSKLVVLRFNEAINARDLDALVALMTEDHRFIDYVNICSLVARSEDHVVVLGRSSCSHAALRGPAIWTAIVRDGLVLEWRVRADTPEARAILLSDMRGV